MTNSTVSRRSVSLRFAPEQYHVHLLVYFELHGDMQHAILREKRLKKWERKWKLRLVDEFNPAWRDLSAEVLGSLGSPPAWG